MGDIISPIKFLTHTREITTAMSEERTIEVVEQKIVIFYDDEPAAMRAEPQKLHKIRQ
jgi:hypothetical protein